VQEDNNQHYSRIISNLIKKIKTTWNITKKETENIHSVQHVPTLLVNNEKLKDPKNLANGFNNFFIEITKKLNIQQLEKGNAISNLKDSFPGNFPSIKIIPITETETKI
jgi:hypothetical protein